MCPGNQLNPVLLRISLERTVSGITWSPFFIYEVNDNEVNTEFK